MRLDCMSSENIGFWMLALWRVPQISMQSPSRCEGWVTTVVMVTGDGNEGEGLLVTSVNKCYLSIYCLQYIDALRASRDSRENMRISRFIPLWMTSVTQLPTVYDIPYIINNESKDDSNGWMLSLSTCIWFCKSWVVKVFIWQGENSCN